MGIVTWRFVLTWMVLITTPLALIALTLLHPASGLAVLAALALLAVLDYRAYAARTNAFAVWAWAVTRYLDATRIPLSQLALDTRLIQSLNNNHRAYLDPAGLPARDGDRPHMVYGLPHRQLNQHPTPLMRRQFRERLASQRDLSGLPPRPVQFRESLWELTGAEGLVVQGCTACTCSAELGRAKGEFAHLHSHDGSMHMMLSPPDIITVIRAGWGDLFAPSAGLWGQIPAIVLVYAPRTPQEADIVARILRAAYAFATTPALEHRHDLAATR